MPRRGDDDEYEDDRPRRRRRRDDDEDEYDDRPRRRTVRPVDDTDNPFGFAEQEAEEKRRRWERDRDRYGPPEPANGTATTALVFGILSLIGGLTAIPGLIAGMMGMKKAKRIGAGYGVALTGTILSGFGLLVLAGTAYLTYWYFGPNTTREVAVNNMKRIGLALHEHQDANDDAFPPALAPLPSENVERRKDLSLDELSKRLGWRVAVLPFLKQDPLHKQFRAEPWDSLNNLPLAAVVVPEYADRGGSDPDTRYRVVCGGGAAFDSNITRGFRWTDFLDGTSNTIMVVETPDKVKWPQYKEVPFDPTRPPLPSGLGKAEADRFLVVMADGSVKYARKSMNPQVLSALITRAGGEVVPNDWNR